MTRATGVRPASASARQCAAACFSVKKLGAELTIGYTQPDWAPYDGAGGGLATATLSTIIDGGRLVSYGTTNGFASHDQDDVIRRRITLALRSYRLAS